MKPYTLRRLDPPASTEEMHALEAQGRIPTDARIDGVADVFVWRYGGEIWQYRDDAYDTIVWFKIFHERRKYGSDWHTMSESAKRLVDRQRLRDDLATLTDEEKKAIGSGVLSWAENEASR